MRNHFIGRQDFIYFLFKFVNRGQTQIFLYYLGLPKFVGYLLIQIQLNYQVTRL